MKLLLDTQVLIWAGWDLLPTATAARIADPATTVYFSTASLWEIVIKNGLKRADFRLNTADFWHELLANGYRQLDIAAEHILAVATLPRLHADPFDRLLIAQANTEHLTLLTTDARILQYPGEIEKVAKPRPPVF